MSLSTDTSASAALSARDDLADRILRALAGIEYGSVEIVIQDSRVVQIERHQKARFARPLEIPRPPAGA